MTDRPGDCWTCGHPSLRPKGHAEWCEQSPSRVYYAREADGHLIKIGFSVQVDKRMATLGTTLLASERGGRDVERQRHQQFDRSRVKGEWFRPTADLLAHITALEPDADLPAAEASPRDGFYDRLIAETRALQGLSPTIADDPVGVGLAARFLTSALSTAVEPSPATELAAVDNGAVGPSDHATPTARSGKCPPSTSAGVPNGTAEPAAPPTTNKAPGVSAPRASNSAAR